MAQTLNGVFLANYSVDVGQWRHVQGNYNFTDDTGAQAAYTIFTVTGDVLLNIFGSVSYTHLTLPTILLV